MFAISWDTLVIGATVALLALYLLAQLVLRFDAMKLFEAWRLARRETRRARRTRVGVHSVPGQSKPTTKPRRRVS